jgi:hypothetical protein
MYLCLSSASREGYGKDVVDTLAVPICGERQFRYDQKWVDPGLRELIKKNTLPRAAKCLLCFVDLRGNPRAPFILPLREAVLTRVMAVGTTYTLVFQLGAFRRPTDTRGFSDFLWSRLQNLHHFQQVPGAQERTGYLWVDAGNQLDAQLERMTDGDNWPVVWEEIVRDYIDIMKMPERYSKDFLDEDGLKQADQKFEDKSPFYVFYDLLRLPERRRVKSISRRGQTAFELAPGSTYELSFYQYHPFNYFADVSLALTTAQSNIQFVGNTERRFNTRYDVKRFIFSTAGILTGFNASMLVARVFHDKDARTSVEDFYLNYEVKRSAVKICGYALAIGAAFAAPQLITLANASTSVPHWAYASVLGCAALFGIVTTLKDAFTFK